MVVVDKTSAGLEMVYIGELCESCQAWLKVDEVEVPPHSPCP